MEAGDEQRLKLGEQLATQQLGSSCNCEDRNRQYVVGAWQAFATGSRGHDGSWKYCRTSIGGAGSTQCGGMSARCTPSRLSTERPVEVLVVVVPELRGQTGNGR